MLTIVATILRNALAQVVHFRRQTDDWESTGVLVHAVLSNLILRASFGAL